MGFLFGEFSFENDDRLQTVYSHFESNLKNILSAAAEKDCHVLLSTIAVNLLDCPPFISDDGGHAEASYGKGLAHQGRGDVQGHWLLSKKLAIWMDFGCERIAS